MSAMLLCMWCSHIMLVLTFPSYWLKRDVGKMWVNGSGTVQSEAIEKI